MVFLFIRLPDIFKLLLMLLLLLTSGGLEFMSTLVLPSSRLSAPVLTLVVLVGFCSEDFNPTVAQANPQVFLATPQKTLAWGSDAHPESLHNRRES